jgi:DNA-directed RNA polymerase specialized sigma subunit
MTTKDRLKSYYYLKRRTARAMEKVEFLFERAASPPVSVKSRIGEGRRWQDPMGDLTAEYMDEAARIKGKVQEIHREGAAIEALLSPLPEPHRTVMELRYLEALDWEDVIERLNYSQGSIFRIHRKALQQLEDMEALAAS